MTHPRPTPEQLRDYAEGRLAWFEMRQAGIGYDDVLAGLGALGLRPPLAPLEGVNAEARRRGIEILRSHLAKRRQ